MHLRRSLLFMPGDDLHKISKGAALDADGVIMDLEDGVALNRKEQARQTVVKALSTLDFGRVERLIRINPFGTGLGSADLTQTVLAHPAGYVLPKVESAEDIRVASEILSETESQQAWEPAGIRLLAIIETARGVMNLKEITAAGPRLDALIFGAEDLAGSIGATRTPEGWEVFYARSAVVIAAAAGGLQSIDTVYVQLHDLDGLARAAQVSARMGFSGKLAIHPRQVPVINQAFAPSPQAIERARRLLQAHTEQQAAGTGAFSFEGQMVDRPMVRAAQTVLATARAAGLIAAD